MSDQKQTVSDTKTYQDEIQAGATTFEINYADSDKPFRQGYLNNRLYVQDFLVVGEGDDKTFPRIKDTLAPAYFFFRKNEALINDGQADADLFSSFSDWYTKTYDKGEPDLDLFGKLIDSGVFNDISYDNKARQLHVKPGAVLDDIFDFGLSLSKGSTVAKNKEESLEYLKDKGRVESFEKSSIDKITDRSSELAEGATSVVHTSKETDKEWDRLFINNRRYLRSKGDKPQKEVFQALQKELKDKGQEWVIYDADAMSYYAKWDGPRNEEVFEAIKNNDSVAQGVFYGDRLALNEAKYHTEQGCSVATTKFPESEVETETTRRFDVWKSGKEAQRLAEKQSDKKAEEQEKELSDASPQKEKSKAKAI